jgi:hypothetical protein
MDTRILAPSPRQEHTSTSIQPRRKCRPATESFLSPDKMRQGFDSLHREATKLERHFVDKLGRHQQVSYLRGSDATVITACESLTRLLTLETSWHNA